ncbi:MAG: SurA N-terminal domain-containing protein [Kiritimatiellae bacterium]|nr:SurA N-terminal domain-containing protein [Kiritimatiellia bacterium]
MTRKAYVDGEEIAEGAVTFELSRLVKFYTSHGIPEEDVKKCLPELEEKALEQAIGAKLLLARAAQLDLQVAPSEVDGEVAKVVAQIGGEENYRRALAAQKLSEADFRRELEKGVRVNKLVEQACAGVPEPSEEEIAAFYDAQRRAGKTGDRTLVDLHDQIRDLLRHDARGRAMDAFVAELRADAKVEYR